MQAPDLDPDDAAARELFGGAPDALGRALRGAWWLTRFQLGPPDAYLGWTATLDARSATLTATSTVGLTVVITVRPRRDGFSCSTSYQRAGIGGWLLWSVAAVPHRVVLGTLAAAANRRRRRTLRALTSG